MAPVKQPLKTKKESLPTTPVEALALIEETWHGKKTAALREAFALLSDSLLLLPHRNHEKNSFHIVPLLNEILARHDHEFLKRQLTYQLAAAATLQELAIDAESIRFILDQLLSFMTSRSPRRGNIILSADERTLKDIVGIEILLSAPDEQLKDHDNAFSLRDLYTAGTTKGNAGILTICRQLIVSHRGHLWCEITKNNRVEYHLFLPRDRALKTVHTSEHAQTYQYDIRIKNFMQLRKYFGIKKSAALLHQMEHMIQGMIRHPLDLILSSSDEGIITVIYESGANGAESLASRISKRLSQETFRIGKKITTVHLHHTVTPIPEPQSKNLKRS